MTSLFLEATFIARINQLTSIPFPLAKYMLAEWFKMLTRQPSRYQLAQLTNILRNQGSKASPSQIISTLQYLFLVGKKQNLTAKQVAVLLKQNTILAEEYTQLIVSLYSQFLQRQAANRIEGADKTKFSWSAISLRQANNGQICNRLYMKVEFQHLRAGVQHSKTFSMTLLEFKLFCQEMAKVESLII